MENNRPDRLNFDIIFHAADQCLTGTYRKGTKGLQHNFRKGEIYFYSYLWNELYRLPLNGFLAKFLNRIGIGPRNLKIEKSDVEVVPKLMIAGKRSEPDIAIETDKNLVFFEFKNYSSSGESIKNPQLVKEYLAGLKHAKGKPFYYVIVQEHKEKPNTAVHNNAMVDAEELKRCAEEFIKEFIDNDEQVQKLRKWNSEFKPENLIRLNWDDFLNSVYEQIKESKNYTKNKDLIELYDRVEERITEFVSQRENDFFDPSRN